MKSLASIRILALLLFAIAMALSSLAAGRALSQDNALALKKIAPGALNNAASGKQTEFLVLLSDQADLGGARRLATKKEKGRFVRDALWNKARSTQEPILAWLRERNIEHRSFYIVNMIWVKADLDVAMAIAARSDVRRIEGNPQIRSIPDPPELKDTISQLAALAGVEPGINYTRAPEVWAMGFTGEGIVVGGADTGYQWDHPALQPQYRGWNGVAADHDYNWHDSIHSGGGDCGADSLAPCDDNGHGTHTMGTAVGDDGAGNQIGMAPGAKWIGCRNMDRGNGTPATYIECFEFFLAPYPVGGTPAQGDPSKAPHVTTNSWTCPPSEGCSVDALRAAVEAQQAAGIMTVVAAGNSGSSCSSVTSPPAIYDASYTVGALTNGTDTLAGFSSRGPVTVDGSNRLKPDIAAPGTSVRSSIRGNGYASFNGTSMATPHVAGAVALLWSAQPALRYKAVETRMLLGNSAVPIKSKKCAVRGVPNNLYGFGRLDIKAAVDLALISISPASQAFSLTGGRDDIRVMVPGATSWNATSNANWIQIISSSSGAGDGIVKYAVMHNLSNSPREGTMTIAGKSFTVNQAGAEMNNCSYNFPPKSKAFRAVGGTGSIEIAAGNNCDWQAVSLSDWITINSNCCGTGNGEVTYSVSENTAGKKRKGFITIGGKTFKVKQKRQ